MTMVLYIRWVMSNAAWRVAQAAFLPQLCMTVLLWHFFYLCVSMFVFVPDYMLTWIVSPPLLSPPWPWKKTACLTTGPADQPDTPRRSREFRQSQSSQSPTNMSISTSRGTSPWQSSAPSSLVMRRRRALLCRVSSRCIWSGCFMIRITCFEMMAWYKAGGLVV